ncbi:MAG TPA: hypothetical protein VFV19_12245 [Candidatus Polarisedimenticolaceae bacterium]|nr:hypothetical protein [Candidatus Polarisedimenticolaceae bacterium]
MPRALRVLAVGLSIGLAAATRGFASEPILERFAVDVSIDPQAGTLHETAAVTVRAPGATHLVFAIDEGLAVKRSSASEGVIEHRQAGPEIIVDVDPPIAETRTLTFAIAGAPGGHSDSEIGERRAVLAPATPWYPSLPSTWATGTLAVHLPKGWRSVATSAAKPVRSLAVAAAPDLAIKEGAIPGTRFVLAGAGPLALERVQSSVAPALSWLSGALSPYPFSELALAVLPGYTGRVEASGIVIVGSEAPLAGPSDAADLLAGQWWGQLIAGDGAWVDAFAAWEACVFARDRDLPVPGAITAARAEYFALRSGDVPIATARHDAPAPLLRGKGSAVPDMIRLTAGDRAMFDAVRELVAHAGPSPLSLAAVRAVMEKHAGRSLERAFDEWFGRAGAPEIAATLSAFPASSGGYRADLQLVQKRGVFALPVEVVLYGPGGEQRETVEIDDASTSVFYIVPFEPKRVEIDPLDRIFRWK